MGIWAKVQRGEVGDRVSVGEFAVLLVDGPLGIPTGAHERAATMVQSLVAAEILTLKFDSTRREISGRWWVRRAPSRDGYMEDVPFDDSRGNVVVVENQMGGSRAPSPHARPMTEEHTTESVERAVVNSRVLGTLDSAGFDTALLRQWLGLVELAPDTEWITRTDAINRAEAEGMDISSLLGKNAAKTTWLQPHLHPHNKSVNWSTLLPAICLIDAQKKANAKRKGALPALQALSAVAVRKP